ncbi:COG0583 Transcriptional regulator [Vibrio sp. B1FLJ16]|uniref:LysR family transcriptional regulator n=1 Tax=Vibrio sp. B1FLJ16 TaxID=2751178 RepID=UPI0015F7665A|nr:LysR family transcriptional regulator [Vibrio sp. B1FLJ16]CAD7824121.1 COG0583 Transcriptional regulator [Vibrio sp. B1FLJ16]CAE6953681.1 COG0583 Transcriptional regulator [Vibrio sp. B1FLJ16]
MKNLNNKKRSVINQITDFDIKLIRLFKTVVECGSYTATEPVLGITKSAISLQMSDLEKRLNMKLCHRGRGGITLTDEGEAVLESADILLASVEQFRNDVNQINNELRGELNIALVNNLVTQPHMKITQALKHIRQMSEKININITMSTPADIEKGLIDGRFHVGAFPANNQSNNFDYRTLYNESYYLYCSNEHPFFGEGDHDTESLKQTNSVITRHRMSPEVTDLYQKLKCTATASDHEGITFLILTGTYIGFLPQHYADYWCNKGQMRPLFPDTFQFSSDISLVTRSGLKHNQIINKFLEIIE